MSKIHGLQSALLSWDPDKEREWTCFCGRIFYTEKEFRDHVNQYG